MVKVNVAEDGQLRLREYLFVQCNPKLRDVFVKDIKYLIRHKCMPSNLYDKLDYTIDFSKLVLDVIYPDKDDSYKGYIYLRLSPNLDNDTYSDLCMCLKLVTGYLKVVGMRTITDSGALKPTSKFIDYPTQFPYATEKHKKLITNNIDKHLKYNDLVIVDNRIGRYKGFYSGKHTVDFKTDRCDYNRDQILKLETKYKVRIGKGTCNAVVKKYSKTRIYFTTGRVERSMRIREFLNAIVA